MERMTFRRLRYLREAWRVQPPMQMLLAAQLGYKPPEDPQENSRKLLAVMLMKEKAARG